MLRFTSETSVNAPGSSQVRKYVLRCHGKIDINHNFCPKVFVNRSHATLYLHGPVWSCELYQTVPDSKICDENMVRALANPAYKLSEVLLTLVAGAEMVNVGSRLTDAPRYIAVVPPGKPVVSRSVTECVLFECSEDGSVKSEVQIGTYTSLEDAVNSYGGFRKKHDNEEVEIHLVTCTSITTPNLAYALEAFKPGVIDTTEQHDTLAGIATYLADVPAVNQFDESDGNQVLGVLDKPVAAFKEKVLKNLEAQLKTQELIRNDNTANDNIDKIRNFVNGFSADPRIDRLFNDYGKNSVRIIYTWLKCADMKKCDEEKLKYMAGLESFAKQVYGGEFWEAARQMHDSNSSTPTESGPVSPTTPEKADGGGGGDGTRSSRGVQAGSTWAGLAALAAVCVSAAVLGAVQT